MAWSPDGRYLVVGNTKDRILWIDVEEQKIIKRVDKSVEVRRRSSRSLPLSLITVSRTRR